MKEAVSQQQCIWAEESRDCLAHGLGNWKAGLPASASLWKVRNNISREPLSVANAMTQAIEWGTKRVYHFIWGHTLVTLVVVMNVPPTKTYISSRLRCLLGVHLWGLSCTQSNRETRISLVTIDPSVHTSLLQNEALEIPACMHPHTTIHVWTQRYHHNPLPSSVFIQVLTLVPHSSIPA